MWHLAAVSVSWLAGQRKRSAAVTVGRPRSTTLPHPAHPCTYPSKATTPPLPPAPCPLLSLVDILLVGLCHAEHLLPGARVQHAKGLAAHSIHKRPADEQLQGGPKPRAGGFKARQWCASAACAGRRRPGARKCGHEQFSLAGQLRPAGSGCGQAVGCLDRSCAGSSKQQEAAGASLPQPPACRRGALPHLEELGLCARPKPLLGSHLVGHLGQEVLAVLALADGVGRHSLGRGTAEGRGKREWG